MNNKKGDCHGNGPSISIYAAQ